MIPNLNNVPRHVEYDDIGEFHAKFGVPESPQPAFLDAEAHKFRSKFMQEELDEFQDACIEKDMNKAADALGDLVYVAIGTARKMGIPWPLIWSRIQAKNMVKELAAPDGSNSKRGSPMDVIKPEGWTPPEHWDSLGLQPGQPVPVFNATAAVLKWGEQRRASEPMSSANDFLEHLSQAMQVSTGGAPMQPIEVRSGEVGVLDAAEQDRMDQSSGAGGYDDTHASDGSANVDQDS